MDSDMDADIDVDTRARIERNDTEATKDLVSAARSWFDRRRPLVTTRGRMGDILARLQTVLHELDRVKQRAEAEKERAARTLADTVAQRDDLREQCRRSVAAYTQAAREADLFRSVIGAPVPPDETNAPATCTLSGFDWKWDIGEQRWSPTAAIATVESDEANR